MPSADVSQLYHVFPFFLWLLCVGTGDGFEGESAERENFIERSEKSPVSGVAAPFFSSSQSSFRSQKTKEGVPNAALLTLIHTHTHN